MQSLWSRAGQARHCGCKACSQVLNGASRRATTRVQRRKVTFAEVFTACYSSVFASAALIDAVRKEDRKQELDRQLDEARRDLAALKQQAPELRSTSDALDINSDSTQLTIYQMDNLYQSIRTICKTRPFMKEIKNPAERSASDLIRRLQRDYYRCPDEVSIDALGRIDYDALEKGLIAEAADGDVLTEMTSHTHLLRTTRKSRGLVKALLRTAHEGDEVHAPSPSVEEVRGLLVSSGFPRWGFPQNQNVAKDMMASLHRSLKSVIAAPDVDLKEKIGKVCYNLLTCPYPPDMHTYNTLIAAFDRAGLYKFSEEVAYSYFFRQTMKPTPLTHVALLNHYKESGLVGRFIHSMSVLAGADRVIGAKLHRKDVDVVKQDAELCKWASDRRRRTVHGDWVFEHVPFHRGLAENLVHGLLHFKLFDAATAFFVACMQSGVVLGSRVTKHILDGFILALDWGSSVRLIRELTNCDQTWHGMLQEADADTISYFIDRIYVLLDLCGIYRPGRLPSQAILANLDISGSKLDRFLRILEDARPSTQSISVSGRTTLLDDPMGASKSRLLQIESLWKEYVTARNTIISLERKLIRVELPQELRQTLALHIGSAALERSIQLSQEFTELLDDNKHFRGKTMPTSNAQAIVTREDDCQAETDLQLAGGLRVGSGLLGKLGERAWQHLAGVWVHDALKRHVVSHSKPIEDRVDYLERPKAPGLGWLDEWESEAQERVKYPKFGSRISERGFYWEGREFH